ncbi:bifunctional glutamate N-acetyltransferase/amino-acid acetyltransferase ArgJ [Yoonia sp.]|uniref:bifunctional glutamate N-acetyltransferase/amino-acid acetyltransferase ArgJ n=1 Tax=Yoonia sp. TaxID=2212373 RepID=UPI00391B8B29
MKTSPLAPAQFPDLPVIAGVTFASAAAGVKYQNRTDVMLAIASAGSSIAGVFTRSATRSAPVLDCQAKLGGDPSGPAAILVNSGNSNAFTGKNGVESVTTLTHAVADQTGVSVARVFTASTGVIGEPLPHDRIIAKIAQLHDGQTEAAIKDAARAIMTTDTFPKGASATIDIGGQQVQIAGIAKGSGMIAPDMATMLVYIFTDALIGQDALQKLISQHNDQTFNCITVDSDTSTSDSLIAVATGASGVDVTANDDFSSALHGVMLDLAHQVVRDGEGATKFVTVAVTGAADDADARKVAMAIANSPLVKTAIAGHDANWGRVVMAVGKSGAQADRDKLSIRFGDITVAENGWRAPDYSEDATSAYMKNDELLIGVDLGLGDGARTVWTCDLTHGYIDINADYRS